MLSNWRLAPYSDSDPYKVNEGFPVEGILPKYLAQYLSAYEYLKRTYI